MDDDDPFCILTPYPGTVLYKRMAAADRLTTGDWDRYDTRHVVFRPARMTESELESGYWRAYRQFYRWSSIIQGAAAHDTWRAGLRHAAYAAGWKKFEPMWDLVIRMKRAGMMLPVLETILRGGLSDRPASAAANPATAPLDGAQPIRLVGRQSL